MSGLNARSRVAPLLLRALATAALSLSTLTACDANDLVDGDDFIRGPVSPNCPDCPEGPEGIKYGDGEWAQWGNGANGCDLTGKWIAQIITTSSALGADATAYNWYYYDITDNGDTATINRGWDCSFEVCSTSSVAVLSATSEALALRNRQDGELDATTGLRVAPRRVTYKPDGPGMCYFEMEKWWWLRGLDTSKYYPPREEFETATHIQMRASNPIPTKANQAGSQDWDNDGRPGIYLSVESPAVGSRDVGHRDWNKYGPARVHDGVTNFIVPADFDADEVVFAANPALLDQVSQSLHFNNRVRFIRLPDNTDPPEDSAGFRQWCVSTVNREFRDGMCGSQVQPKDNYSYFKDLFSGHQTAAPYPF